MQRNSGTRNPDKEKFWREKIKEQIASGLSQFAFCKREGLNPNTFSSWKTTIKNRDAESIAVRKKRKNKKWSEPEQRQLVEHWRSSGLSQADFCRQAGIQEWQLSAWKRKEFRENKRQRERKRKGKIQFAEVRTPETSNPAPNTNLPDCAHSKLGTQFLSKVIANIRFGRSAVISIFNGADYNAVRAIITAIVEFDHAWSK